MKDSVLLFDIIQDKVDQIFDKNGYSWRFGCTDPTRWSVETYGTFFDGEESEHNYFYNDSRITLPDGHQLKVEVGVMCTTTNNPIKGMLKVGSKQYDLDFPEFQ